MKALRLAAWLGLAIGIVAGWYPALAGEDAPGFPETELRRIESAYQIGLERSATPDERLECLRQRYAALYRLMEITYESTLSWVANREGLAEAMQNDQTRWRSGVDALVKSPSPSAWTPAEDLEQASKLMLDRIGLFDRLTSEGVFTVEFWG